MIDLHRLKPLLEDIQFAQAVVTYAPVWQYGLQSGERRQIYLAGIGARICCHKGGYEHVAIHAVYVAHLGRERQMCPLRCGEESSLWIHTTLVARAYAVGHHGYVAQELVEGCTLIAVVRRASAQCGGKCHMGLGIRSGVDGGYVVVHKHHLVASVVGAIAGERYLQAGYGLQCGIDRHFLGAGEDGRCSLSLIAHKPSVILGFLDVALIDKAERKVESGRHNVVVACLTEDVAYLGDKLRQTCRLCIAYLDIEIAHRHQAAKCVLCYLAPHALVFFLIFQDGEFKIFVHLGENLHTVFVYHARLHCKRLTIGGLGTHFHLLGLHIVLDDGGGVLLERYSAHKALWLLLGIYIALVIGEAVVDVL